MCIALGVPFIFDLVLLTSPEVLSKVRRKHFLSSSMYLLVLLQHFYSVWQTGIDVRVGTEAEARPAASPYCISLVQSSSWNRVVELCFERDGRSISPVHPVIWALHLWSVYTGPSSVQTGPVQLRTRGLEETGPLKLSALSLSQLIEEVPLQSMILHHRVQHTKAPFLWPGPDIPSVFVFSLSFSDTKGKETF